MTHFDVIVYKFDNEYEKALAEGHKESLPKDVPGVTGSMPVARNDQKYF